MDFEKHMITSLSALLKKKEHLQLAFYGKLHIGSISRPHEYYCFFGLAESDLLIICYSPLFHKNGFTVRVPLHIDQVKIKKKLMSEKYSLCFRLNNTDHPFEKFKIVVKSEHPQLKVQKKMSLPFYRILKNMYDISSPKVNAAFSYTPYLLMKPVLHLWFSMTTNTACFPALSNPVA